MQNPNKAIQLFREEYLFSKEDIICSFKLYMDFIEDGKEENTTHSVRGIRLRLCENFLKKIEKCKLPTLSELYWFYEYEFTGNSIELNLCSGRNLECDEDECLSMSSTVEHTLISSECNYLTVDGFAKAWDVEPVTVRQWIRRGKLRTAKKAGRDWLIPELANKPQRGYETAYYIIDSDSPISVPEFPLVVACDNICIYQDDQDKKSFICIFGNFENEFREELKLNRKEVESLEYALISSGKTTQGGHIQYMPFLERSADNSKGKQNEE